MGEPGDYEAYDSVNAEDLPNDDCDHRTDTGEPFFFKVEVYISGEVEETIADDDYDEDDGEEALQHDGDKCNEEDDEDDDGEDNVEDHEDGEGDGGDDDGYR